MTAITAYRFTVFTPTFNRAHTLGRVYESLKVQTSRDFEWLIVDDGSSDGTRALVESWVAEAWFPIRYIWQPNQGKHVATNRAAQEARGELFLTLDSDDACLPQALERLACHWESIPAEIRHQFAGVTVLCQDHEGQPVGNDFPASPLDSDSVELRYRYHVDGEKWGFQRTTVMRAHPFPEIQGVSRVSESLVWDRIGLTYKTRFVNEVLRIYYRDAPSEVTRPAPWRNAAMYADYYRIPLNEHLKYFFLAPVAFFRSAALSIRCSFYAKQSLKEQLGSLSHAGGRLLWLMALPVGAAAYLKGPKPPRVASPTRTAEYGNP